jgi:hypothetical protein
MSNVVQFGRSIGGYVAVTAATTQTQAAATPLTGGINFVTTGNASDAVLLPSGFALGDSLIVVNSSGVALGVFPGTGGKINNGTGDAVKAMAANMSGLFISLGSNNWAAVLSA